LIAGDLTNGALPLFLSVRSAGPIMFWESLLSLAYCSPLSPGFLLALIQLAVWLGDGRLDMVAPLDGIPIVFVLRDLDPDAFPPFPGGVGVGLNCELWPRG